MARRLQEVLLQLSDLYRYGILPAHATGYPLPAQGDVLPDLQSARRKPQLSHYHVRQGIHLFSDLHLMPKDLPGTILPGSL